MHKIDKAAQEQLLEMIERKIEVEGIMALSKPELIQAYSIQKELTEPKLERLAALELELKALRGSGDKS